MESTGTWCRQISNRNNYLYREDNQLIIIIIIMNLRVTVIPTVIGALRTIPKGFISGPEELEIGR